MMENGNVSKLLAATRAWAAEIGRVPHDQDQDTNTALEYSTYFYTCRYLIRAPPETLPEAEQLAQFTAMIHGFAKLLKAPGNDVCHTNYLYPGHCKPSLLPLPPSYWPESLFGAAVGDRVTIDKGGHKYMSGVITSTSFDRNTEVEVQWSPLGEPALSEDRYWCGKNGVFHLKYV